jgi:membrane associated rhomboid family serine protease
MVNPNITKMFAKRSELIMNGQELYRLFTPMFLHGSVSHLMLNSFSMNNIGPEMERSFGSGRFLATYIIGGIAGNMASAYYTPNPSLGASGAVFGLMGAYYTFLSRNEDIFGRSGQAMMGRIGSTIGMNIIFGMMMPQIDNWAHIGGAVGGVFMATTFGPKLSFMGLPSGGRIIVDKPAMRLPNSIESIPGKISKRLRKGRRRMQVQRYQSEMPAKPWRRNRYHNMWQERTRPKRRRSGTFNRKPMYGE